MTTEEAFRIPFQDPENQTTHFFAVQTDPDRWLLFEATVVGTAYSLRGIESALSDARARVAKEKSTEKPT